MPSDMNSQLPGRRPWILSEKIKGREAGRRTANPFKAPHEKNRVSYTLTNAISSAAF